MTRRFSAIGVCLYGFISAGLVACGDGGESKEGPWPNGAGDSKGMGGSNETGGTTAKGGSTSKGGTSSETGGKSTGTGGASTATTTTTPVETCTASFVNLTDGGVLTDSQDSDGDYCQNGYSYNVIVATTAKDGTKARLILNGSEIATTTVSNATAKFTNAPTGNEGKKTFEVEIGDTTNLCTTGEVAATIDCLGMPSCTVSTPTFDPTKRTALNFVAVASGGDRVSSMGSPYQTRLSVATNVENGQPVAVTVDGGTDKVYGVAINGTATFPGVTLSPDGAHQITATCSARSGANGVSSPVSVNVDTTAPSLTVAKGTGAGATVISALTDGDHFGPADDADPITDGLQLRLCGTTTDADATDLASILPAIGNNFCVAVGGNTPTCGAVKMVSDVKSACVNFTCPGNGPFDLALTLKDDAQNPTTVTRTGLTCAAANPIISFLDPVANDETFSDKSKRILASYNTEATKTDMNPTQPGSQYVVTACTSAPAGSTATLKVGRKGDTELVELETVTSTTSPSCLGSKIEFPLITLPESLPNSDFTLKTPTEVAITVTDINKGSSTEVVDVWVDSNSPTLTVNSPIGLCGKYFFSAVDISQTVILGASLASDAYPVDLTVTPIGSDGTPGTPSFYQGTSLQFTQCSIPNVVFKVGKNALTARVTEPSGNFRTVSNCTIEVGQNPPPVVTWVTPISTSLLTAQGNSTTGAIPDGDAAESAAGWQGTLKVCTDLSSEAATGITVQFKAGSSNIGEPVPLAFDSGKSQYCATLPNATVPEGAAVVLSASTSAGMSGSGSATITVPVDVVAPSAPLLPVGSVADRRKTSFNFNWRAPADGAGRPSGYQVKVSNTPITDLNFDSLTDTVPYTGTPGAVGTDDGILISNRMIEKDYYFAVRAVDIVGNKGPIAATTDVTRANFLVQTLTPPTSGLKHGFGWVVDGGSDINADGYSDVIVGTQRGTSVYVFFGSSTGVAATPSLTFTGDTYYGYAVAGIGDINGDTMDDFAIANPLGGNGRVDVFFGKKTWVAGSTITSDQANIRVTVDAALDPKYTTSQFGFALARLGDINSDTVDDFAIGAPYYNHDSNFVGPGQVTVIFGKKTGLASDIVLPTAYSNGAMQINGDDAAKGSFGLNILGIGQFFSGNENFGMVVAAPYTTKNTQINAGELYAFSGVTGMPGTLALSPNAGYLAGTIVDASGLNGLGMNGMGVMGNFGPSSQQVIGVFDPRYPAESGRIQFFSGTSNPFTSTQWLTSNTTTATNKFGRLVVGGAIRGTNTMLSYIGTANKSDIVVASRTNDVPKLLIVDGTKLSLVGGSTDVDNSVNGVADVTLSLPSAFVSFGHNNTPSRDINLDTYADFAVGEVSYVSATKIDGSVVVYR